MAGDFWICEVENGTDNRGIWNQCDFMYFRNRRNLWAFVCAHGDIGGCMKEVMQEYAATVIGWLGLGGICMILFEFFYGRAGYLAMLIQLAVEG